MTPLNTRGGIESYAKRISLPANSLAIIRWHTVATDKAGVQFYHNILLFKNECLRNRCRKWTLQDLIDSVNDKLVERYGKSAGKRTIQDDLKYMKEEKEAPIEKKEKKAL